MMPRIGASAPSTEPTNSDKGPRSGDTASRIDEIPEMIGGSAGAMFESTVAKLAPTWFSASKSAIKVSCPCADARKSSKTCSASPKTPRMFPPVSDAALPMEPTMPTMGDRIAPSCSKTASALFTHARDSPDAFACAMKSANC